MPIETFDTAERAVAVAMIRPALDLPRWAEAVVDARPYGSLAALEAAAMTAASPLSEAELDAALAPHARIGEIPEGDSAEDRMSRREQSGIAASAAAELAEGNAAYEARFGRVFLIRAAGRSAEDILAALRERLGHTPEQELAVIETQLREIAARRIEGLLA